MIISTIGFVLGVWFLNPVLILFSVLWTLFNWLEDKKTKGNLNPTDFKITEVQIL